MALRRGAALGRVSAGGGRGGEPGGSAERVRRIKQASELEEGDRLAGPGWPPYEAAAVERTPARIVVEWTNGSALRVKEYDPSEGVLVETLVIRPAAPAD